MCQPPLVSCLCPTYRRPRLLANALACFMAQDYPAHRRELIILDDGGDFPSQSGANWKLIAVPQRFPSLPEKFNVLASLAQGKHLVIWEDDDVYVPWHLSTHVKALQSGGFSKPSSIWSVTSGHLRQELAKAGFHASIAMSREALAACGGWPLTKRADFDRQLLARLEEVSTSVDPCQFAPPSYVFRWNSTHAYHGQNQMLSADDETWYDRCQQRALSASSRRQSLKPEWDHETELLSKSVAARAGPEWARSFAKL